MIPIPAIESVRQLPPARRRGRAPATFRTDTDAHNRTIRAIGSPDRSPLSLTKNRQGESLRQGGYLATFCDLRWPTFRDPESAMCWATAASVHLPGGPG
jgi:hypothetical protein